MVNGKCHNCRNGVGIAIVNIVDGTKMLVEYSF